jgi:hypothetical protein
MNNLCVAQIFSEKHASPKSPPNKKYSSEDAVSLSHEAEQKN